VNESRQGRAQQTDRSEKDAKEIDCDCANEVLPNDLSCAARDCQRLRELQQVVAKQYDVRALSGHIRT
jgi:hypothetical protein